MHKKSVRSNEIRKTQKCRHTRHPRFFLDLGQEAIQIRVRRALDVQVAAADIWRIFKGSQILDIQNNRLLNHV